MEKFSKKENFEKTYKSNRSIAIARIRIALRCNNELAEDLSTRVFVKLAKHLDSFDESKSCFNTWMNTIVTRVMIDYKRSKQGQMNLRSKNIEDFVDSEGSQYFQVEGSADMQADINLGLSELEILLNKTLASFSEIKRKVCNLQMQGYQMNEIAEEVNIPENTVKVHVFRFRKEMAEKLKHNCSVN